MKLIKESPIIVLFFSLVINIPLLFWLILILADGILKYNVGFIVTTPIILIIPLILILTYYYYFSKSNLKNRHISITIFLIVLGLITLLLYLFNLTIWIDLFDGSTDILLP